VAHPLFARRSPRGPASYFAAHPDPALVTVSFLCVDIGSRRLDEAASFTLRCILKRLGPAQSEGLCGGRLSLVSGIAVDDVCKASVDRNGRPSICRNYRKSRRIGAREVFGCNARVRARHGLLLVASDSATLLVVRCDRAAAWPPEIEAEADDQQAGNRQRRAYDVRSCGGEA
jgi:hypothetical protein